MPWRIKYLDEKKTGVIKKNFAVTQRSLSQIASVKRDDVTFLLKWHDPEILQRVHGLVDLGRICEKTCRLGFKAKIIQKTRFLSQISTDFSQIWNGNSNYNTFEVRAF